MRVWQSILDYLADVIESVQKRALKIVFLRRNPEALGQAHLLIMQERRKYLCYKYVEKMKSRDHAVVKLLPRPVAGICNYKLRKNSPRNPFYLMPQLLVGPSGQIHFYI